MSEPQPPVLFGLPAGCVWLVLAGLAASQCLGSPVQPLDHFTNWQTQQGLPSNKIMAALQTGDGYLWIGTYDGLVRFDGVKFTVFDSSQIEALHDSSVTNLYESPDGTLWIAHPSGAITSLRDGVFTAFPPRRDWKGGEIKGMGADAAGDIWIWDDTGDLARLRDGYVLKPETGSAAGIRLMTCSKAGQLWVSSRGTLSSLDAGQLSVVPLKPEMGQYVQGICAAKDGGLWVVAQGRLWKWTGAEWSHELGRLSVGHTPMYVFIELADGRLVAGTSDHGAIIVRPEPFAERVLSRANGFASDWVVSLAQDHEGGLWIGTGGAGLFRSRTEAVRMLVAPDDWQGRSVLSVSLAQEGGLWVGTEGAGLYRWDGREWTNFARDAGLRNPYVWAVTEDFTGQPWLATWGGGLYSGEAGIFSPASGFEGIAPPMKAILPSRGGGLWVGAQTGVFHYHKGVVRWLEPGTKRQLGDVRAITEAADGSLWIGTNGHGLGLIQQDKLRRYTRRDGLPSDFIHSLFLDADDVLWVGTRGAGVARFKHGHFATIDASRGLADDTIGHIAEDRYGFVWLSSHDGLMRVSKAELNHCADGELSRVNCLSYGLSDGLSTLACSGGLQPAGCTTADGQLIFATDRGPAVVDPSRLTTNAKPPPVVIESVSSGGSLANTAGHVPASVTFAAGTRRIEIKYTGLSFAASEKVRFKRQLEGLEAAWVEADRERVAVYNFVPPGEYRFSVTACNNDNVWNPTPATVTIVIPPHFWQTRWFRLILLAALVLGTAGAVWHQTRRRLQRRVERLERQHAVQAERTRIANDMHDDLGAHLTRITMLSETVRAEQADSGRTDEALRQIYETARGMTRALDEIVWAVNPKHDTLESLVYYFEKFAQDLLGAAGMRCRLEMPGEFAGWNPSSEVRHNLFLAYKEALNNAVRHSGADMVTVSLEMSDQGCRVTVSDNGRGLAEKDHKEQGEPASDRIAPGHGFASMRARLSRLGGTCEIRTAPGGGCVVALFVPAVPHPRHPPADPATTR